ncbi:MAG: right-handed parallel beta-helix repeat-containing protein [Candidatus Auribacterota bacterium]
MKLLCGTLAGLGILVSGIALAGTTYYVGPAGDDTNDGITLPWATIQHGVESLSQGDTLIVQEGIYYEPQGIMIDNDSNPNISGTETEPTRIVAQGNVEIVVDSETLYPIRIEGLPDHPISWVTIEGFTLRGKETGFGINGKYLQNCEFSRNILLYFENGIALSSSTSCRILQNKAYKCIRGILLDSSPNTFISQNNCSHGRRNGIELKSGCDNTIISENICSKNATTDRYDWWSTNGGIYIETCDGVIIRSNFLSDSRHQIYSTAYPAVGIYLTGNMNTVTIQNNIFLNNCIHLETGNVAFEPLITNNILYSSGIFLKSIVLPDNEKKLHISNNIIDCASGSFAYYYHWWIHTDIDYSRGGHLFQSIPVYSPYAKRQYGSNWEYYGYYTAENIDFNNNIVVSQADRTIIHFDNDTYDAGNINYNFFSNSITNITNLDNEGTQNIYGESPYFRNSSVMNYQLLPESPCRATGFNNHTMGIYGGEYAIIDTDNDGIPDEWEIRYYLNTNAQDDAVDSDNDGLTNYQEFFYKLNPQDNDSDNDGLPDNEIIVYGTSPYYCDSDFDTLSDYEEVMIHHTNPLSPDSDGDGLSDYTEINGWTNGQGTFYTSPNDPDSDDDKLNDGAEKSNNANPFITDTDNDGLSDYNEVTARAYIGYIYYTSDPSVADTDNDGASDYEEDQAHTNPRDPMFNPTHSPTVTIIDWDYYTEFTLRGSASGSNSGAAIENVLFCIKAGSPSDEEYELALINGGAGTDNVQFVITKELFEYAYNLYIKTYDADGYYGIQYFSLNNTINNPYLDSDGDGINNWEETHIYHSNPFAKDTDNDGQNDRLEVWAGSDPNNSESVFTHSISHNINGDILISWNCLTGRVYSVLVSDEPDGVYVPLMTEITNNTNGEISVIDSGLDENNNEYHDEEDIYPPYLEYELVSRRCYKIAVEMPE